MVKLSHRMKLSKRTLHLDEKNWLSKLSQDRIRSIDWIGRN